MKKVICLFMCFVIGSLLFMQNCCAQYIPVSGYVGDADTKAPIAGAALTVKGSLRGVLSEMNGTYSFSMSAQITQSDSIICSAVLYETQEKKAEWILNFYLEEEADERGSFAIKNLLLKMEKKHVSKSSNFFDILKR